MGSQKFSKIITKTFSKASQEVTLSISLRDRNHELIILLFTSKLMRSDSKTARKKSTNPQVTASPLAFTASLPKQKHSRAKSRQVRRLTAQRKNHYHDFVTLLPKYSATVLHGLQPG